MLERIGHRGPDDRGEVQVADAWLGHTRLSIVDVESGHQPLQHQRQAAVDGGQRRGLQPRERARAACTHDTEYATRSDNEVALHVVRERGPRGT